MSDMQPPDVHAPQIRELLQARDWAGLARCWLAHRHLPALDAAVGLLTTIAQGRSVFWADLAGFLAAVREAPCDLGRVAPGQGERLPDAERLTIGLLLLFPRLALCELARAYPPEHQQQVYRLGLESAEQMVSMGRFLKEPALIAHIRLVQAGALLSSRQWEAARDVYTNVVVLYRDLVRRRPDVYRGDLARALHNLGLTQANLGVPEAARDRYAEALTIFRELARRQPDIYRPEIARTLGGLGIAQGALGAQEAARESYAEALTIYRALAQQRPEVYRPELAVILTNVGNTQIALGVPEAARDSFTEAVTVRSELARLQPNIYRSSLAMTLCNLGNAQFALGFPEAARDRYVEAATILRELDQLWPEAHRPGFARTLNNLGEAQCVVGDPEAAKESIAEALSLYRELVQQRPDLYRPDLALTLNHLGTAQRDLGLPEAARDSITEALAIFRELAGLRPEVYRLDLATTLINLGKTQMALSLPKAAHDCLSEALASFRELAQRRPDFHRPQVAIALNHLGSVQAELGDPKAAQERYTEAMRLFQEHAVRQPTAYLPERQQCWHNLGCSLLQTSPADGKPDRAQARAAFHEARRCAESYRGGFQDPDRQRWVKRESLPVYESLVQVNIDLWRRESASDALHEAVETAEASRAHHPVRSVSFAEVWALVPADGHTALVQYCLTAQRGFALVITRDEVVAVDLPDLASNEGWELAEAWYESYYGGNLDAWEAALPDLLRPVAERAVRPVVAALRKHEIHRLVLAPHQALHRFPLHACPLADGAPLADHYEVVYTPSLSILHHCVGRPRPQPTRLALIENPTLDLPFAAVEGAGLRRLSADATVRHGRSTRREELLLDAPSCHVFHYSGQTYLDLTEPLCSALVLGNKADRERWLTLRHIFGELNLGRTTLAVLHGCESGMMKLEPTDEHTGLASGILIAGATCVLSTLWKVNHLSSALLSLRSQGKFLGRRALSLRPSLPRASHAACSGSRGGVTGWR